MTGIEYFLLSEIYICEKRAADYQSDCFNGVSVGVKEAKLLNDKHIMFCKHLLKIIRNEWELET